MQELSQNDLFCGAFPYYSDVGTLVLFTDPHRRNSEILWAWFETTTINTAIKWVTQIFGFPRHIKVMDTLCWSLLSVQ